MKPTKQDFIDHIEKCEKWIRLLADSPISQAKHIGQKELCEQIVKYWDEEEHA